MTQRQLIALAAAGSAALLIGAFIFQAMGYLPCKLCYWQRWPHADAIVIGALALVLRTKGPLLPVLGGLSALATAAIGVYHSGIERRLWAGPTSCTGNGGLDGLSGGDLLATGGPRLVLCDQISWELFNISMANWNVIFSLVLAAIWFTAARRA